MKIYFAGSITGGRGDQGLYSLLIKELQKYGTVLTEHIGDINLTNSGEVNRTSKEIFERDMEWVREADVLVAEITTASLGVGYELGLAQALGKRVLCLYREVEGKRLSAMISGNSYFTVAKYTDFEDATVKIKEYFATVK